MTPQEVMARAVALTFFDRFIGIDEGPKELAAMLIAALEAAGFRVLPATADEAMQATGNAYLDAHARPVRDGIVYPFAINVWHAMVAAYHPEAP